MLRIALLGYPQSSLNDEPLTGFLTSKAEAVLYYAAVTGIVHSRAVLAGLLWPEQTEAAARKNLRDVLSNLRRLVGGYLRITRNTVSFNHKLPYWLDVELYYAQLHNPQRMVPQQLQAAIDLYRGDFLAGFHVRKAEPFEFWLRTQRETLHQLAVHGMHSLIEHYSTVGADETALILSRRLLQWEPWDEEAHCKLMMLLARTGKRSAALRQYEACRTILADELGVPPLHETTTLYQQIRAGHYGSN